jgi:glycosyltransferase involved in cell wall biosynthesis
MKTILHISADFPDPLVPEKTRAVENLLAEAKGFRHIVYSVNRVSWRKDIALFPFAEDRTAIAYGAPPYGIRLAHHLALVAEAIRNDLEQKCVMPDLIHAHKFSVEGLIASELSENTGIPYVASLWGDTDIKIFETKKTLRPRYRKIASNAALLLPPAPWTREYFSKALSLDPSHFELLPVMTAGEAIIAPRRVDEPRLISVFALDSWRRKGLDILSQAAMLLEKEMPELAIDVYGRGSPRSLLEASQAIQNAGAANRVRLMGPLPHAKVQSTINRYTAFVMTPRRETFGMVHVEAVLAGVPILWSKGRGIDGLFDGFHIGCRCDPNSAAEVADGIRFLVENERELKKSIARRQSDNSFQPLRRDGIGKRYTDMLARLTGKAVVRTGSFRSRHRPRVS